LNVPIFDLLGHRQECLLNVSSILCRGLEEGDVQLIREFLKDPASVVVNPQCAPSTNLCNTVLDDLLTGQVGFVANEELINPFRGITINLLEPLLNVGEGVCNME